jgi:hypothetical protein
LFKLKLELPLSLPGCFKLSALCCELGLLFLRFFLRSLFTGFFFLFLDLTGLDLLL